MTMTINAQSVPSIYYGDLNGDDVGDVNDVTLLIDYILKDASAPSTLSISLAANNTVKINIPNSANHTVTCSDATIATATLEGSSIVITGKAAGTATVTLTNTSLTKKGTAVIDVTVTAGESNSAISTSSTETGTSTTTSVPSIYYGDLNGDDAGDVNDVTLLIDHILKDASAPSTLSISLAANNTVKINIPNSANHTVTSSATGTVTASLDNSSIVITGKDAGTATVTLTNTNLTKKNTAVIDVTVTAVPLTLSANTVQMNEGTNTTVNITSGNGNYEVTSLNSNVVEASISGTTITLTGKTAGTATVTVKDTPTSSAVIEVTVIAVPLTLSANTADIENGLSKTVSITQGSGNYSITSSNSSVVEASLSGTTITLNGKGTGTATVTVTDTQTGRTAEISVTVTALTLSANSASVEINKSTTVSITSGSGSYSVASSDNNVVGASLSGTTITLNGVAVGTATVTVTDTKTGKTAEISVTVTGQSYCPNDSHPHAIDLGLTSGTKWSCCNVGASKPEGYGSYYAWGETTTRTSFTWGDYTLKDDAGTGYKDIGESICGNENYDAAYVNMGSSWQMPTSAQIVELFEGTTRTHVTLNGVEGILFTSNSNQASIFIPASGYYNDATLTNKNSRAYCWSGSIFKDDDGNVVNSKAGYFEFGTNLSGTYEDSGYVRKTGFTIRPVK